MVPRFEITGIARLLYALDRSRQRTNLALAAGLYQEAQVIFGRSQREVPVRFGFLKASGHVTEPTIRFGGVEVTIGYGGQSAPYAVYVHERIYNPRTGRKIRHDPPTKAKFLEDPALAYEAQLGPNLARRVAAQIFGGPRL